MNCRRKIVLSVFSTFDKIFDRLFLFFNPHLFQSTFVKINKIHKIIHNVLFYNLIIEGGYSSTYQIRLVVVVLFFIYDFLYSSSFLRFNNLIYLRRIPRYLFRYFQTNIVIWPKPFPPIFLLDFLKHVLLLTWIFSTEFFYWLLYRVLSGKYTQRAVNQRWKSSCIHSLSSLC